MLQYEITENLSSNETIEGLQCGGMKLIQNKSGFRFGTDAVLLADFAKDFPAQNALDLCCGNGIIPILMAAKTRIKKLHGLEIQPEAAALARRSVALNGLERRVEIRTGDLKDSAIYPKRHFNMITCNPPYMKTGTAIINENDAKTIARHEVKCTLDDIFLAASRLLDVKGRIFMVHRPARLAEVMSSMKRHRIEPKRLRLVFPDAKSEPTLFLIEGLLFGGEEIRIMPPLFLKNEQGGESEELKRIYNREMREE